jgi:hypothetical protein
MFAVLIVVAIQPLRGQQASPATPETPTGTRGAGVRASDERVAMVKILPSPGRNSSERCSVSEAGNRVFHVFVAVKNKYCVFSTFADVGKSTNPQVRRF